MANGDAALAAGMDILDGNEDRREGYDEINKTRDYIAERTSEVTSVDKGGTGATTAEGARANLGLVKTLTSSDSAGKIPEFNAAGQLPTGYPTSLGQAANKQYVDNTYSVLDAADDALNAAKLDKTGGTVTGHLYLPGATAATSGWTVCYINSDGRVSRGSSSERYKKYISDIDPASLGDLFPQLVRYQMRNGDGSWKYGHIAERLDESDDLKPFVVYQTITEHEEETDTWTTRLALDADGNPVPESIDFIMLLMAQNAQLHQAVDLLAQRVDALESGT